MSDRGMKKFAPFASLIEQSDYLEHMRYEKNKKDKPVVSSEKADEINELLTSYHGQEVEVYYFYDGYVYKLKTRILKIDIYSRKLHLEQGDISFSNLVDIKNI